MPQKPVQNTDTDAFRRWFAGSRVVDAQGRPLVVYHGSKRKGFRVFEPTRGLPAGTGQAVLGEGIYFTVSAQEAKRYAGRGGQVVAAFLRVTRPFRVRQDWFGPSAEAIAVAHMTREVGAAWARDQWARARAYKTLLGTSIPPAVLTSMMQAEGFDGVVEGPHVCVFDPRQIKSATDNVGTFDPDDPSFLAGVSRPRRR